jgi:YHS domain-containing protein
MLQRTLCRAALAAGLLALGVVTAATADDKKPSAADQAKARKALQEVQDFIGTWNLEGTQKDGAKTIAWKEQVKWGWKFNKDGDAWISVSFAEGKGKYFTTGDLKYDVEKKLYALTLTPSAKGAPPQTHTGTVKSGVLKVEHKDEKSKDVSRLTLNTLSEGDKFAFKVEKQDGGKGLFANVYAMNGQKEGATVAGGPKKPECIVSGGAASMAVTYNGKTYYVCCSGCRDEFNANPAKYAK